MGSCGLAIPEEPRLTFCTVCSHRIRAGGLRGTPAENCHCHPAPGLLVCPQGLAILLLVMPKSPPGTELRPPIHQALIAKDVSAGCQKTQLQNYNSCCTSHKKYSLHDIFCSAFSPTRGKERRQDI